MDDIRLKLPHDAADLEELADIMSAPAGERLISVNANHIALDIRRQALRQAFDMTGDSPRPPIPDIKHPHAETEPFTLLIMIRKPRKNNPGRRIAQI